MSELESIDNQVQIEKPVAFSRPRSAGYSRVKKIPPNLSRKNNALRGTDDPAVQGNEQTIRMVRAISVGRTAVSPGLRRGSYHSARVKDAPETEARLQVQDQSLDDALKTPVIKYIFEKDQKTAERLESSSRSRSSGRRSNFALSRQEILESMELARERMMKHRQQLVSQYKPPAISGLSTQRPTTFDKYRPKTPPTSTGVRTTSGSDRIAQLSLAMKQIQSTNSNNPLKYLQSLEKSSGNNDEATLYMPKRAKMEAKYKAHRFQIVATDQNVEKQESEQKHEVIKLANSEKIAKKSTKSGKGKRTKKIVKKSSVKAGRDIRSLLLKDSPIKKLKKRGNKNLKKKLPYPKDAHEQPTIQEGNWNDTIHYTYNNDIIMDGEPEYIIDDVDEVEVGEKNEDTQPEHAAVSENLEIENSTSIETYRVMVESSTLDDQPIAEESDPEHEYSSQQLVDEIPDFIHESPIVNEIISQETIDQNNIDSLEQADEIELSVDAEVQDDDANNTTEAIDTQEPLNLEKSMEDNGEALLVETEKVEPISTLETIPMIEGALESVQMDLTGNLDTTEVSLDEAEQSNIDMIEPNVKNFEDSSVREHLVQDDSRDTSPEENMSHIQALESETEAIGQLSTDASSEIQETQHNTDKEDPETKCIPTLEFDNSPEEQEEVPIINEDSHSKERTYISTENQCISDNLTNAFTPEPIPQNDTIFGSKQDSIEISLDVHDMIEPKDEPILESNEDLAEHDPVEDDRQLESHDTLGDPTESSKDGTNSGDIILSHTESSESVIDSTEEEVTEVNRIENQHSKNMIHDTANVTSIEADPVSPTLDYKMEDEKDTTVEVNDCTDLSDEIHTMEQVEVRIENNDYKIVEQTVSNQEDRPVAVENASTVVTLEEQIDPTQPQEQTPPSKEELKRLNAKLKKKLKKEKRKLQTFENQQGEKKESTASSLLKRVGGLLWGSTSSKEEQTNKSVDSISDDSDDEPEEQNPLPSIDCSVNLFSESNISDSQWRFVAFVENFNSTSIQTYTKEMPRTNDSDFNNIVFGAPVTRQQATGPNWNLTPMNLAALPFKDCDDGEKVRLLLSMMRQRQGIYQSVFINGVRVHPNK